MGMDKENLKELLQNAREKYKICQDYFDNCDSDMIGVAIHNLNVCEKEIQMLRDALEIQKSYVGEW